jgi:probable rRNA maturation factor
MKNMKSKKSNYQITVQNIAHTANTPSRYYFQRWINMALTNRTKKAEITIRLVGKKESALLNKAYRNKAGATNILSFSYHDSNKVQKLLIGDLVICAPVIKLEAKQQKKSLIAHWAHLVIHGALHLLGYDHIKDHDAKIMEKIEIKLLQNLKYPNPY